MRIKKAAAALATCAALAACGVARHGAYSPAQIKAPAVTLSTKPDSWWGVFAGGTPASYAPVAKFAADVRAKPRIVPYYSGWGETFQATFVGEAKASGAVPLVQIDPYKVSLAAIAAGRDDTYLRSYAEQVRAYGSPVIIGFGHEMNGPWYTWGVGRTSASVFVAAWRHIVTMFGESGADNVTWLWTVNAVNATRQPLARWWPGSSYVTWIGIDGYYYFPSDTFASVFGATLTEIRKFTRDPALISETGIGPGTDRPSRIADLFAGVRAQKLLGVIWFDQAGNGGIYHQDWRLEDSRSSLAAFREAVAATAASTAGAS
jgi:glycosyl hydrolase family 26